MGASVLSVNSDMAVWTKRPSHKLISNKCWGKIGELARLSGRELEVGRLIFEGQTRIDVAESLGISTRTVRHYMEILHEKLNVNNRVELVLRMIQIRDHLKMLDG